ncbi:Putative TRAP-type transporter small integral membrane subunit, possible TauL-like sulfonate transporter (plasmid) [Pseudorhizobium banfieldiae]|uniref:TRAP transporter small permease protein n=2 Tax=Pseudorhizobium banfieldiae TaxID=1125847 RepID=L0NN65_9HYPH|nr:TRAP transporter small permease [arsenite-oxidising bacterium NT-25]CCF22266.1 Putative TRAP-type transporter small integral membrane subunit, possible TauL-like sulfonate transporter [Pseudorhizobium banfieldiae]
MRLIRLIDRRLEEAMIVLCCTIMVVGLSFTAIVRYFLSSTPLGKMTHMAEELSVFAFVFLLYFGSVLAARENGHFRVSAHLDMLPARLRHLRFLVGDLLWLGFCIFASWQGVKLVQTTMRSSEPSMSLNIPMQYIYAIIPLAFALTAFRILQRYALGRNRDEDAFGFVEGGGE